MIGGALYYMLVVGVLPRCTGAAAVLDAHTLGEGIARFARATMDTVAAIFAESSVSLAAFIFLFCICLGFCRSGGVGTRRGAPPYSARRWPAEAGPRPTHDGGGGLPLQLLFAGLHSAAHLLAAVTLLLLLELGVETVQRYEGVGRQGYHSLYRWYREFEAIHFPDPAGVRDALQAATLGLYPNAIKWLMALFDIPEALAVSRARACASATGAAALGRGGWLALYGGTLAYYWLLATPTVGALFGAYLYACINWLYSHYDEAFSSLQWPHHKALLRAHVTPGGALEIYSLVLDAVPHSWAEDPRWRTPLGGGCRDRAAHRAKHPSRWVPLEQRSGRAGLHTGPPPESQLRCVDFLRIERYGAAGGGAGPAAAVPPVVR